MKPIKLVELIELIDQHFSLDMRQETRKPSVETPPGKAYFVSTLFYQSIKVMVHSRKVDNTILLTITTLVCTQVKTVVVTIH